MTEIVPEAVGDVTNTAIAAWISKLIQIGHVGSIGSINFGNEFIREAKAGPLLTAEQITSYLTGYVRSPAREPAAQRLRDHGAVLLYGPRGTGRTTTALDILPSVTGRGEIRHVIFDPADELDVARLPREAGTSYLLDISDPGDLAGDRVARFVSEYAAELRTRGAHLVVVARDEPSRAVRTDMPAVRIEPPAPGDVFAKHLDAAGLSPELITRLREAPLITGLPMPPLPADVAELAARLVHEGIADDESFDTTLANAVGAFTDWKTDLLTWFRDNGELGQRAFLFTTAMLHEAPGSTVSSASRDLTRFLDPENAGAQRLPLQGPPLGKRAEEIGADLDSDGAIRFNRPGYDPAVRHFVWQNYAEYRPELSEWITKVPGDDTERTVRSVIDLVSATSDEILLKKAADSWTAARPEAAVLLLSTLATDPRIGQRVRALLYGWAYDGTQEDKMLAVAAVCAVYGTAYEQNALTRLRQLARHPRQKVLQATIEALRSLATDDAARRRRILDEVTGVWITDSHHARAGTGRHAFAVLARQEARNGDPILLRDLANHPDALAPPLADGVRALLHTDSREAEIVVNAWADAVASDATLYRPVLDTLVRAAAGDSVAASRLTFIANRWADGPDVLHAFQHTLTSLIERSDPLIHDGRGVTWQEDGNAS